MGLDMKIALVLSGQTRSYEQGYEYINKNLLSRYDVDVFFHTWSKNWNNKILELYNAKQALVEDPSIFGEFKQYRIVSESHPAKNTIMMYRSMKYADSLRQNSGIEYDWIVRTRFDFALNKKINFEELDSNKMYFCDTRKNEQRTTVHDQFVIANSNDMKTYCNVYENIDAYHSEGCVVNGEDLLIWHLNKNNLLGKHKIEYMDLYPPFLNGSYNCGRHSLIRDDMEKWVK
jgi:hypothetical protein